MKKTIKALVAVMVVFTLCLGLLAGCAADSPAGTWKCTSAEAMGVQVDPAEMGSDTTMVLNEDGTCTTDGEDSGTWTLNGSEITFSNSGVSITGTYNGSSIVIDMGIAKMTYTRA